MKGFTLCILAVILGLSTQIALKGQLKQSAWVKDTFNGSNGFVDKCRSLSTKAIFAKYYPDKRTYNFFDYALEIYKKVNTGILYKLFFAFYDKQTKEVKFFTALCKTSSPSAIFPSFNVESTDEIPAQEKVSTDEAVIAKIKQGIEMVRMQTVSEAKILQQYALPEIVCAYFYIAQGENTKYIFFGEKASIYVKAQLV